VSAEPWLGSLAIVIAMLSAAATFSFKTRMVGLLGAVFGCALLAILVAFLHRQPIVGGGLDGMSSFVAGPGMFEPPSAAAPVPLTIHPAPLFVGLAPILAGLLFALAQRGAARARVRAVAVACGAIGMGVVAAMLAVPRGLRPSPEHYLETLQRVGGPVEQDRPFRIGAREYRLTGVRHSPIQSSLMRPRPRADGSVIDYGCVLVGDGGTMPIGVPLHAQEGEETCLPVLLRVDPRGDYAVLYSACPDLCAYLPSVFAYLETVPADAEIAAFAGTSGGQRYPLALAFRVLDGAQVRLTPELLAGRLAAPRSFLLLALGGAATAAVLLAMASGARRRRSVLADAASAMEATAFVAALVLSTPLAAAHAFGL
jgi:hypothetical protein